MNSEIKTEKSEPDRNKKEIENIVNGVADELERRVTAQNRVLIFIKSYSIELFSAVSIGFLVTIMAAMFPKYFSFFDEVESHVVQAPQEAFIDTAQATNRHFYVRAMLSQVLSDITFTKIYFSEYVMATGKLPSDISDLGYSIDELKEYDYIEDSFLTKESGIGVLLSKDFGENKTLVLLPKISVSASHIKWKCITNIDEKYLGISKIAVCEYRAGLQSG